MLCNSHASKSFLRIQARPWNLWFNKYDVTLTPSLTLKFLHVKLKCELEINELNIFNHLNI